MRRTLFAAVAALAASVAAAKEGETAGAAAESAQAQPAPKLPPEGKRWVDGFVGRFQSKDVEFTMGDKVLKGSMNLDCTRAAAGWATFCNATMTLGKAKQSLALLYGWDTAGGKAHMFEVTNTAEVHDHVGGWTDDKTITVVHTGKTRDGKQGEDGLTFAWQGPKKVLVTGKGTADGAPAWSFSGTFTKK